MIFSSPVFLFQFLPVVLALHLIAVRRELRTPLLLVASLYFYYWGETWFVFMMIASIVVNYLFGLWIDRTRGTALARLGLAFAVVANLALLCAFKYANFFVDNLNAVISVIGVSPIHMSPVHLPIGISFFTFQAMSYVIDVYRRDAEVQKNPVNVALYISLFPQLVAGPIVRYRDIAAQLVKRSITLDGFATGIRRFITGLAKKVLIADVVAKVGDQIFQIPSEHLTPGLTWLGGICFTLQVYFDFSGYSDMAIGLGRMFGFRFLENFDYPYIARSIRQFWKRWHISLTTWFRDYLYFPMGGSRGSVPRTYFNLVVVFFLCGLWHGARWNYVIWGFSHGVFLVLERTRFGKWIESTWAPIGHVYMLFVFIVTLSFFRTSSLAHAAKYMPAMFGIGGGAGREYSVMMYLNAEFVLALIAGIIFCTPVIPWLGKLREKYVASRSGAVPALLESTFSLGEVVVYVLLLVASAAWMAASTYQPFIYFRF
jgi:alginate O-acetyltransferase complex protein AlgI